MRANPILTQLEECINSCGQTYAALDDATGVSRAILWRLANRQTPLISVQVAGKIAKHFGLELRLVRVRKK